MKIIREHINKEKKKKKQIMKNNKCSLKDYKNLNKKNYKNNLKIQKKDHKMLARLKEN